MLVPRRTEQLAVGADDVAERVGHRDRRDRLAGRQGRRGAANPSSRRAIATEQLAHGGAATRSDRSAVRHTRRRLLARGVALAVSGSPAGFSFRQVEDHGGWN